MMSSRPEAIAARPKIRLRRSPLDLARRVLQGDLVSRG
jgi:hypothetical protein